MSGSSREILPPSDLGIPLALLGLIIPHGICTVIVLSRLVARIGFLRKWFLDDSLIVAAYLFGTAVCVIYGVASQRPDVLHADELALQASMDENSWAVHPYILRTYLGLLFYQVSLCLTKISILTFYLRLFSSSRPYRRTVWITIGFVIAFGIPMLLMSVFQCHPGPGQFFGRPMQCCSLQDLLIASSTFHALTDAWLMLLIMPAISGLDIPSKQKAILSVVLNFGIFVICAGVIRLALSLRKDYRPDMTGVTNSLAFFIMTVLEVDLAIICASAPTLRPLFAGVAPWIMADPRRKSLQPGYNPHSHSNSHTRSRGRGTHTASVNLTSRISYNGYPWTEPTTPGSGSRNTSVGSRFNRLTKKAPQPTSVSLSRMMAKGGSKSARLDTVTSDGRPILNDSRPSSVAVSGHGDEQTGTPNTAPLPPLTPPLSPPRSFGQPEWRQSDESLVMGLSDPAMGHTPLSPAPVYNRRSDLAAPERSYNGLRRETDRGDDGGHMV